MSAGAARHLVEGVEEISERRGAGDAPNQQGVLAARAAQVRAVAAGLGTHWHPNQPFGPFDLCFVTKAWRGTGWTSRVFRRGFFHQLNGIEVSIDGACSYFTVLANAAEPNRRWLSSITGEWAIEEATFCFYAAFSKVDLRVTVRLPAVVARKTGCESAVNQFVVHKDGITMGCTSELWKEVRLCAGLRALALGRLGTAAMEPHLTADLMAVPKILHSTAPPYAYESDAESELLQLAAEFYSKANQSLACSHHRTWLVEDSGGCNAIGDAIFVLFADSGRYEAGLDFFTQLAGRGHLAAWLSVASFFDLLGQPKASADALEQLEKKLSLGKSTAVADGRAGALSTMDVKNDTDELARDAVSDNKNDTDELARDAVSDNDAPDSVDAPAPNGQLCATSETVDTGSETAALHLEEKISTCQSQTDAQFPPVYAAFLRMKATTLGSMGPVHGAIQVACEAVAAESETAEGWLLLVRLLFAAEEYALALLALNETPLPDSAPQCSSRHTPGSYTEPADDNLGRESGAMERQTLMEEFTTLGNKDLIALPACRMRGIQHQAYELLVLFANTLGWEELLDLRASLFLVDSGQEWNQLREDADVKTQRDESTDAESTDEYASSDDDSPSDTESSYTDSTDGEASDAQQSLSSDDDQHPSKNDASTDSVSGEGTTSNSGASMDANDFPQDEIISEPNLQQEQSSAQPEPQMEPKSTHVGSDVSWRDLVLELCSNHEQNNTAVGAKSTTDDDGSDLGQRYISEELDDLFQALYHDIAATARWLDFPDAEDSSASELKEHGVTISDEKQGMIRAALAKLKMADLRRAAIAARLDEGEIDAIYDTEDPKASFVEVLCEACVADPENVTYPTWLTPFLDQGSADDATSVPPGLVKSSKRKRSSSDWVYLGDLAMRLDRPDDAELAYRHAVDCIYAPSYKGWSALLTMYARSGFVREALIAAEEILLYLEIPATIDDLTAQVVGPVVNVPHCVLRNLTLLCSKTGLQKLRDVARTVGVNHQGISELFLEIVRWHSCGYDR